MGLTEQSEPPKQTGIQAHVAQRQELQQRWGGRGMLWTVSNGKTMGSREDGGNWRPWDTIQCQEEWHCGHSMKHKLGVGSKT